LRVELLRAEGFRNLTGVAFAPCEDVNVICGHNAQGKTNLLEALWLFTGARSFRGSKESEYIGFGKDTAELSLNFYAHGRAQSSDIRLSGAEKHVYLNGIDISRTAGELSGRFCAAVFSPDHLDIIKSGPKNRRALIDASLCQAYPKYGKVLDSYGKILRQRAFILKDIQEQNQLLDLLDAWDQNLIEYGGYITWMRARYVSKLAAYGAEEYAGISGGREKFSAFYRASCDENSKLDLGELGRAEITGLLAKAVGGSRKNDIRLAQTNIGPHRDDIEVETGGKSARIYGSQGQQRSCVLALKLAECRILEESLGEPPIVLLDDVMSELDEGRRSYILNCLTGRQVFISCCEAELLGTLRGGRVFCVKSGRLTINN